jgi:uncharacterized protein (DUF488 family)
MVNGLEIYTIGHSNVEASKIVQLLQEYQVDVLVDVRSSPYSQYVTQFNRDTFNLEEKQAEQLSFF